MLSDWPRCGLPATLLLAGCSAAPGPATPARCPAIDPAPLAPTPSAAASAAPATAASAAASAQASPDPYKTLWSQVAEDGEVILRTHREGLVVIPSFVVGAGRGTQVALLDAAGVARWERPLGGLGAVSAAVAPDGSLSVITVGMLNWPKTPDPFEQREVATFSADGKRRTAFLLPVGLSGGSIHAEEAGHLLITGSFSGKVTVAPGLTIESEAGKTSGFVLQFSSPGRPRWARSFPGSVVARPAPGHGVVILQSAEENPTSRPQRIFSLDEKGQETRTIEVPPGCHLDSIETSSPTEFTVVAPPGCFASSPPPPPAPKEKQCALYRLDASSLASKASFALPACVVAADAAGAVVLSEEQNIVLLDAAGKTRWTAPVLTPAACALRGFGVTSVALDATSIYVAGSCPGQRIGTMFNSPYALAYDTSTTYLARYDRR